MHKKAEIWQILILDYVGENNSNIASSLSVSKKHKIRVIQNQIHQPYLSTLKLCILKTYFYVLKPETHCSQVFINYSI